MVDLAIAITSKMDLFGDCGGDGGCVLGRILRRHLDGDFHAAVDRRGSSTNAQPFRHFHDFGQGEIAVRQDLDASLVLVVDVQGNVPVVSPPVRSLPFFGLMWDEP